MGCGSNCDEASNARTVGLSSRLTLSTEVTVFVCDPGFLPGDASNMLDAKVLGA
jgi:hypothetical protein